MSYELYLNNELYTEKYEDQLNTLKWLPWVGKNYPNRNERLFIIGESHYDWNDKSDDSTKKVNDEHFTKHVISAQGLKEDYGEKGNWRIFRNIEKTIYNTSAENISTEMRIKLWSSVAIANLVQRPMRHKKERPGRNDFVDGWSRMKPALETMAPSVVLVVGNNNVQVGSFSDVYGKAFSKGKEKINQTFLKHCEFRSTQFIFIRHASSFFSWSAWGEALKKYQLINYLK